MKLTIINRKPRTRLTIFGKFIIFIPLIVIALLFFRNLNIYLSKSDPVTSHYLVVEGFLPDNAVEQMLEEYHQNQYDHLIITGKPLEQGFYLSGYQTSGDLVKASLIHLGFDENKIETVDIPQTIYKDRTYNTALALRKYFEDTNAFPSSINIFTLGCHSRRSFLLYEKALADIMDVGVIAAEDKTYDRLKYWTTSKGFRTVMNELLALIYASFFFNPDLDQSIQQLELGKYIDEVKKHRIEKNTAFKTKERPLTEEQRSEFTGLNYFNIDPDYKIKCYFRRDTVTDTFRMKTTTDRLPLYANFALLEFMLDSTTHQLHAYQNQDLVNREGYEDYLFVPFKDYTNGVESYGGGRYLDIRIPDSDSMYIDFNLAYNPYCSYNPNYSCPIPPDANHLKIEIKAGELIFEDH